MLTNKGKHLGYEAALAHWRHLRKLLYELRKKYPRFEDRDDEDGLFEAECLIVELGGLLVKDHPDRYGNVLLEIETYLKPYLV